MLHEWRRNIRPKCYNKRISIWLMIPIFRFLAHTHTYIYRYITLPEHNFNLEKVVDLIDYVHFVEMPLSGLNSTLLKKKCNMSCIVITDLNTNLIKWF